MANRHNARSRSDYSRRPYPRQPPPRFYGKLAAAAPFEEAPLMLRIRRTKAFGDLLAYFRHFLLVFLATLHPKAFSKYHYRSPKSTLLRTLLLLLRFSQPYDVYVFCSSIPHLFFVVVVSISPSPSPCHSRLSHSVAYIYTPYLIQ